HRSRHRLSRPFSPELAAKKRVLFGWKQRAGGKLSRLPPPERGRVGVGVRHPVFDPHPTAALLRPITDSIRLEPALARTQSRRHNQLSSTNCCLRLRCSRIRDASAGETMQVRRTSLSTAHRLSPIGLSCAPTSLLSAGNAKNGTC